MKLSLMFLLVAAIAFAAEKSPQRETSQGFASFDYIRDPARFEREGSKKISAEAARALRFAKSVVRAFVEREIQGEFSIAEASWGYQVNFTDLKLKDGGAWTEAVEGFGQVYLSKTLTNLQVQYGP
jgi:hypothetical protein